MKTLFYFLCVFFISSFSWAADTKTSAMTADATPGGDSLIHTIDDPAGTPADRKSTIAQVLGASPNIDPSDGSIEWEDAGDLDADGTITAATDLPTDVTVGTGYIYRVGGTDVSDADMVDAHSHAADSIDAITEIAAALKSGADGTLMTGTAGTDTYTAVFNADGDVVDGPGVPYVVGGTDVADADVADDITLTNITQVTNRAWTDLSGTNWRVTATNGSGVPTEVALGADGTFLMSNGVSAAPTFESAAGGGTITTVKEGDSQVGGADIVTLDFNAGAFTVTESPDTEQNISSKRTRCAPEFTDLAAGDDNIQFGSYPYAITITRAWCRYEGTGTTPAVISFEDASGTAMTTSAALTCIAYTSIPSEGTGLETFTGGNALIAFEGMRFDVDNTPAPTTDDYEICVEYTIDD